MAILDTLQNLPPVICIVLWIFLGYSMILFNKMVLTSWNFTYPFFLTGWHMFFATIITQYMKRYTSLLKGIDENKVSSKAYYRYVVPMGMLFATALVLGNSAYPLLSLSYIQMVKSLTPLPTLLLSFVVGKDQASVVQVILVLVIISGVMGASYSEGEFNIIGFCMQLFAMIADSCRMTIMDMFLCDLKLDVLSLLSLMAPISLAFISVLFILFEYPVMDLSIFTPWLLCILFLNGCLAFMLNFAVILVIGRNSAVIMSIAGIVKDVLLVISSSLLFGSIVTAQQWLFYSMSIIGVFLHKLFKSGDLNSYLANFYLTLDAIFSLNRLVVETDSKQQKHIQRSDDDGLESDSLLLTTIDPSKSPSRQNSKI